MSYDYLDKSNFNRTIKDLTLLIHSRGFNNLTEYELLQLTSNKSSKERFIYNIFNSWKKAQRIIIQIQCEIWERYPNFKEDPQLLFLYKTTQRLMDSIIWHHFGPDFTDIKRLYEYERKIVNLKHHNIQEHIEIMEELNKKTNQFALISDLTSGLRVGDVFCVDKKRNIKFIEVKNGKINSEILNFFENPCDIHLESLLDNKKKLKQVDRFVKQIQKNENSLDLLKRNIGTDERISENDKIHVVINDKPFVTFEEELETSINKINSNQTEIDTFEIESCLKIVTCINNKNNRLDALKEIAKYRNEESLKGIHFEWANQLLESTIFKPIFQQPLKKLSIDRIATNEINVFIYFSLEKFQNKFKSENLEIIFDKSRKFRLHYQSIKDLSGNDSIYEQNNGALLLKFKDINKEMYFSTGLFGRLISNLILPSNLIYLHHFMAKNFPKN